MSIIGRRTARALVVLPASGHTLACAALGLMGTPATAALAEAPAPTRYVPATSGALWDRSATRRHVANLREQGDTVVEPEPGGDGGSCCRPCPPRSPRPCSTS